jgi:TetR/AcrR family transcriptional regulator, lmrAB and yxaGH operons repressor
MSSDVRDRMIAGAAGLLAQRGLQATSFSTVLAEASAPRGSIYHHFPGGKDEMVIAAIGATEQHVVGLLDFPRGTTVRQVVESFLGAWRLLLTAADFHAGCALVAVTVAAETDEVRERAAKAFGTWRTALAEALHQAGLDAAAANTTAALLLSACEGAVVMSRAQRDLEPFDTVAAGLLAHTAHLVAVI